MTTLMIHHIHGEGHPPVKGSISLELLEKAVQSEHQLTFNGGLICQELAFPLLKKYGRVAIFFMNNENKMEAHKQVMEALGNQFYLTFWKYVRDTAFIVPKDFLTEYAFYTQEDRKYRYYRDYVDTKRHDEIMQGIAGNLNVTGLFINPQKIVDNGHIIGLQSATHPRRMDLLKPHEQFNEWVSNLAMVRKFQREILYAAHPMGRYTEVTKEILSILGITNAYTTKENSQGFLESPRIDINTWTH